MAPKELLTDVKFKLNDGNSIPAYGLGTYNEDESNNYKVKDAVIAAIESGIRHIDTAWFYETEPFIGEALKECFEKGLVKREDLFITTKVWPTMWNKAEESLERSLKQLGIEYVDLLLQHWPVALDGGDGGYPKAPLDSEGAAILAEGNNYLETYKQLENIKKTTNKVKSIGVSNFPIRKLKELFSVCEVKPVIDQIECHPEFPQSELCDFCAENGVVVTAYSPLGGGGIGAPLLKNKRVNELLKKKYLDYSINEILYSYHIKSGRVVIPKSLNPDRIKSIKHLVPLTKEDIDFLESGPHNRYNNPPWWGYLGFGY